METYERLEDKEIWKNSFSLACFVYQATDRASFDRQRELRRKSRKSVVKMLSSVIEGFEAETQLEAAGFFRAAVLAIGELKKLLLNGYQEDCLSFQEFCAAREKCGLLIGQLLDPGMEKKRPGAGAVSG